MVKLYKDHDIIKLIKCNNESGCKQLIANYGAAIYGIIIRIVSDEHIANDLLKQTMVKFCTDIKSNQINRFCLFVNLMQNARNYAINYQFINEPLKPIYLNTILDLIFNKGLSLVETAKIMNLSIAEVSFGLRYQLKQIK